MTTKNKLEHYLYYLSAFVLGKLTFFIPTAFVGGVVYLLTPQREGFALIKDEYMELIYGYIYLNLKLYDWIFWIIYALVIASLDFYLNNKKFYLIKILTIIFLGFVYYFYLYFGFSSILLFFIHYFTMIAYLFLWINFTPKIYKFLKETEI